VAEFSYDPFQAGPFVVGVRTLQLVDDDRGRQLPCELWYPSGQEIYTDWESRDAGALRDAMPVVLYSHLSGGHRRSSSFLCRHLAAHGYAVAALDHSEVVAPELAPPPRESPSARRARVAAIVGSRVPDLRLALSHLLEERRGDDGDVRVDPARVGVVGHSFGGWTALAAPELEPRVRTVVAPSSCRSRGAGTFPPCS
jgi:predicted dienelactone hydrolase